MACVFFFLRSVALFLLADSCNKISLKGCSGHDSNCQRFHSIPLRKHKEQQQNKCFSDTTQGVRSRGFQTFLPHWESFRSGLAIRVQGRGVRPLSRHAFRSSRFARQRFPQLTLLMPPVRMRTKTSGRKAVETWCLKSMRSINS